jgi:hypothetical protein
MKFFTESSFDIFTKYEKIMLGRDTYCRNLLKIKSSVAIWGCKDGSVIPIGFLHGSGSITTSRSYGKGIFVLGREKYEFLEDSQMLYFYRKKEIFGKIKSGGFFRVSPWRFIEVFRHEICFAKLKLPFLGASLHQRKNCVGTMILSDGTINEFLIARSSVEREKQNVFYGGGIYNNISIFRLAPPLDGTPVISNFNDVVQVQGVEKAIVLLFSVLWVRMFCGGGG